MLTQWLTPVGVVPIFVNAGAALGPLIVAPVVTFVTALFKPRELLAMIRRNPWLPLVLIAIGIGIWMLFAWLFAAPAAKRLANRPDPGKKDWTQVALTLIRNQELASARANRNPPTTSITLPTNNTQPSAIKGAIAGLEPSWSFDPEGGMVLSSPAFFSGKVFCPASVQDVSTYIGILYAVDGRTGTQAWKIEKAGDEDLKAFFSSPLITPDGKSLIVGQGLHEDKDCCLLCINTENGQLRWKVKTPLHIESSPALRGDMVVVGAGAIEDENHKAKSHPGYVFAVRISDGKELWRHDVIDPESSPAIAEDGTIYIGSGFNGHAVVALRSEPDDVLQSKGLSRQIWKTPAKYPITGPVLLSDDLVIVGGGNGDFVWEDPNPAGVVIAVNRKDGSIKWETQMEAAVLGKMAVSNGKLFCPVRNGKVAALNLSDGKVVWSRAISGRSPILAGVLHHRNVLFAVSRDGYLAMINPEDGKVLEKHPLNAPGKPKGKAATYCVSTPVIQDDLLLVGSEAGGLRCFKLISAPQTAGGQQ